VLGTVGKPLVRRGAWAWFRGILTYGGKVIEFQSFSMNKKKLKITFIYILLVATTHGHTSSDYVKLASSRKYLIYLLKIRFEY